MAKNAEDRYRTVTSSATVDSDFGGNMTITYDGGLATVLENPSASVRLLNMRRMK